MSNEATWRPATPIRWVWKHSHVSHGIHGNPIVHMEPVRILQQLWELHDRANFTDIQRREWRDVPEQMEYTDYQESDWNKP